MARQIIGKALLFVNLPFVFLGLIDPLEGGISMLFASAIYVLAFLLLGRFPPKYLWVPFALSIAVGLLTIVSALAEMPEPPGPRSLSLLTVSLLWIYRAAIVATLVSAVITAISALKKKAS